MSKLQKVFSYLLVLAIFLLIPFPSKGVSAFSKTGDKATQSSLIGSKDREDVDNPEKYKFVSLGKKIGDLKDRKGNIHSFTFKDIRTYVESDNRKYIELTLKYNSKAKPLKLIRLEFFTEAGNSLEYQGCAFDDQVYITNRELLFNADYEALKYDEYIYVLLGINDVDTSLNYSDSTLFKIENPYFSGVKKNYVVISNESTN